MQTQTAPLKPVVAINAFPKLLTELREGETVRELSEGLTDLVQAVRQQNKQGTISLKITVQPTGKVGGIALIITDEITVKAPKAQRSETMVFSNDNYQLSLNNPNQKDLPFRELEKPPLEQARELQQSASGEVKSLQTAAS